MKVSIVVPALNEEKYIEATLKSIRAQKFDGQVELIVADGNSSDDTVAIAKKYADKVVVETTRTIAAGRQAGARASTGEIIVYTDADSVAQPCWLARLADCFKDEQVVAAFGSIRPIEGGLIETPTVHAVTDALAWFFNKVGMDYTYGSNMAIRRSAFDRIGGFNIYLATAEDTDIIHRIRGQGKIVFRPSALVLFSTRRIKKWGYAKYIFFHMKNFVDMYVTKTPAKHYEVIR